MPLGDRERAAHHLFPDSVHASPSRSIACRGCGPPSGRFITLMKYGAGATSRNSTRAVVERAHPDRAGVVRRPQVVLLPLLEDEVDRHRRARRVRVQHALDAELHVVGGERRHRRTT